MGILNRDGALIYNTGINTEGLRRGKAESIGIIKGMSKQITGFDVFAGLGVSAIMAFGKMGEAAFDFVNEFGTAMREVETISDSVKADFEGMSDSVLTLLEEIPVDATESAKALYQIVSAGYDGAAGLKLLEVSAKAAVGGVTDTATAADGITTVLNAFSLGSENAEKVADILFTTVKRGKTTFGELSHSIAQVAPLAAAFGISFDELAAAIATLTKSGTTTETAMVQIRGAILRVNEVLGDGAFAGRTMQEAFDLVRESAGGSKQKLKELIPDARALLGVLGLTGEKAGEAATDLEAMATATGSAQDAFDSMMKEFDNQSKIVGNKIKKNIMQPLGQALMDIAMDIMPTLQRELDAAGDDTVPFWGKLVAFLTPGVYAKDFQTQFGKLTDYAKEQSEKMFNDIKTKAGEKGFTAEFLDKQIASVDKLWKTYISQTDEAVKLGNKSLEEGAKRDAYTAYDLLEKLKKARAKFNEEGGLTGNGEDGGTTPEIDTSPATLKKLGDELKQLKKDLETASNFEAVKLKVKIDFKEAEIDDFASTPSTHKSLEISKENKNLLGSYSYIQKMNEADFKKPNKGLVDMSKTLDRMKQRSKKIQTNITNATNEEDVQKFVNGLLDASDVMYELSGLASNFDEELANSLDTIGAIATGAANIATGLAPGGNPVQAAIGGIQILSSLLGGKKQEENIFDHIGDSVDKVIDSLNALQDAFGTTSGTSMKNLTLIQSSLSALSKDIFDVFDQINGLSTGTAPNSYGYWLGLLNTGKDVYGIYEQIGKEIDKIQESLLSNKTPSGAALSEEQREALTEIVEIYNSIKHELDNITKELTGTTTDALADALVQAFREGEDAIEAWGQTAEDVIRQSILNQLKAQYLIGPIQDAMNKLTQDISSDGELTSSEAKTFIDIINSLQSDYSTAFEELNEVFKQAGIDLTEGSSDAADGIAGAIRAQITEETGSELVGLWNRTSIDIRAQLETQRDAVESLVNIEAYTLRSAEALERIEDSLDNNSSSANKRDLGY